jgi:hypothetical protein
MDSQTRKPTCDADVVRWIEESGMGLDERIERLTRAQGEISAIRAVLNTKKTLCECCGLTKYEDFNDAQQADRFDAWIEKIGREIGRLVALRERTR